MVTSGLTSKVVYHAHHHVQQTDWDSLASDTAVISFARPYPDAGHDITRTHARLVACR